MKKIKKLLTRLTKLSRTGKIVRNFALLIVLCLAFWFLEGSSMLTRESALRQMERKLFLLPGETVYESGSSGAGSYRQVFVLGGDYAYSAETSRFSFLDIGVSIHNAAAKADGPVLIWGKTRPLRPVAEDWSTLLFCPWGPENAARAEVTLSARYVKNTYPMIYISEKQPAARGELISTQCEDWKKTVSVFRNEQGFYTVPVTAQTEEEARILSVIFTAKLTEGFSDGTDETLIDHIAQNSGYRLDFYDKNDVLLQSVTGEIERFY